MDENEDKDLNVKIKNILYKSELSFDETRAFFDGLQYLSDEDKKEFISILEEEPDLIYPLYINFKAKLAALEQMEEGGDKSWEQIIEEEVAELDEYLENKGLKKSI